MAGRDYNAPQFRVRDSREIKATRVAPVGRSAGPDIQVGDSSWQDRMFEQMASQGAKVLDKMADVQFSNLYLEGQASAGVIESEEELQGNPLTRDWKVAGYRDTMGKLALADTEAQFSVDIKRLREGNPEDMQEYLNGRRAKLQPGIAGMSREARASAAGQLLLQDRAALKKYTSEHAKFVIDTKSQAVASQWNTHMRTLSESQMQTALGSGTDAAFNEQLRSTAGVMVGSVWMDSSLPGEVKQKLTFEMLQQALANDSVALYDFIQNNAVPEGTDGKSSTLVSRLDGEQQLKLANGYREAMSRTNDARSLFRVEQVARLEAEIDSGTYQGTFTELKGMLDPMVLNKTMDGGRRGAIINKYLDKQYKQVQNSELANAFLTGDVNAIYGAGKDLDDGVKALDSMMALRKVPPAQRMQTYLTAGVNGMEAGFKKAGEYLGVSLRQARSADGTMLPQHVEVLRTVNDAVRKAEEAGHANTRVRLLTGLGEGDRMFAERLYHHVDNGATYEEALTRANDAEVKEASLTPAVRAAQSQQTATAVTKMVSEIAPRGLIDTMWSWAKSAVSPGAATDNTIRPYSGMNSRDGWFGQSATVEFYTNRMREEVAQEAGHVMLTYSGASPEEVLRVSKANVAARTISTEQGPIALPRNVDIQTTFGVAPGNQAAIGKAVDSLLKETKADSRWQLTFAQGRLFAQEFDNKGTRIGSGNFIAPDAIRNKIADLTKEEGAKANNLFGEGKSVKADGLEVKFNGMNTAGVPVDWMYGLRDNLVDHEGVRAKPYNDLSGALDKSGNRITTVGVGVSSHNPHYPKVSADGTVSADEVQRSFMRASNDAARAGADTARDLGRNTKPAFMLMSELAYQSGTAFMTQGNKTGNTYRAFGEAFKGTDVNAAQEAFKKTAAWYYSRDPGDAGKVTKRQRSYLQLIEQSMK